MTDRQIPPGPRRGGILDDASRGPGLLFGVLLVLAIYGVAESVAMMWRGRVPGLVELLIFALLATDTIILLFAVRGADRPGFGWIGLLSVWVLGLIPYFVWAVIYAGGRGVAAFVERHRCRPPIVAFLLWLAIIILCLGAFLATSRVGVPIATAN
jgi:hypothetical protein